VRRSTLARLAVAALLIAPMTGAAPVGAAEATILTFSVKEARAYAYRVSLSKEVIEAARTLQPCEPEEDPYQCDDAAYEHTPNCPPAVALGPRKEGPMPEPLPGVEPKRGGSGDDVGPSAPPRLASPITLNEQLSLGTLTNLAGVLEAGGLASDSYVDLSGRQEPAMHTESDAFSNRGRYEERCAPPQNEEEYAHYLSRSSRAPETYHLAECREGECTFGGIAFGAESEEARTVVHLVERGGKLHGLVHASLHDAVWAGGDLRADLLDSTITFSTDGTPGGLEYSVATAAVGVRLDGEPIVLAPGQPVEVGDVQVGVAAPHVTAAKDGGGLDVVAPGLYFAVPNQTVLFGGAELHVTMGRDPVPPVTIVDPGGIDSGPIGPDVGLPSPSPSPSPSPGTTTVAEPPAPEYAVSRVETGGWVVPATLGAGLLVALLLLFRWVGRYAWGRRLQRARPFRSIDWLYRAFVKT
jgi:hypothetical protein